MIRSVVADALVLLGAAGVIAGAWMAWHPAAPIIAGGALVYAGLRLERAAPPDDPTDVGTQGES